MSSEEDEGQSPRRGRDHAGEAEAEARHVTAARATQEVAAKQRRGLQKAALSTP